MRAVLGVDAGATKTEVLCLSQEGDCLGRAVGGGANYHLSGLGATLETVGRAAREAAGSHEVLGVVLGMAGADLAEDYLRLEEGLKRTLPWPFSLFNDVEIAFRAGSDRESGAILVAGTGANAAFRDKEGQWHRLRAMGYETGTGGGARELARDILHAAFQADEGTGPPTLLSGGVLEALGRPHFDAVALDLMESAGSPERVVDWAGRLVPMAFDAALQRDKVAQEILISHGDGLGRLVGGLARRGGGATGEVDVVLSGGLFRSPLPLFEDAIRLAVHRDLPSARLTLLQDPPALGACLLAAGIPGGDSRPFRERFQASRIA